MRNGEGGRVVLQDVNNDEIQITSDKEIWVTKTELTYHSH